MIFTPKNHEKRDKIKKMTPAKEIIEIKISKKFLKFPKEISRSLLQIPKEFDRSEPSEGPKGPSEAGPERSEAERIFAKRKSQEILGRSQAERMRGLSTRFSGQKFAQNPSTSTNIENFGEIFSIRNSAYSSDVTRSERMRGPV